MGTKVTWAKFGNWSGPQVKGICKYSLPENPTGFDIIVAAVARPEGGAYDTVVAYDGTAVTYGLLQWTFTSGRLHRLLAATGMGMRIEHPERYWLLFGQDLERLTGLCIDFNSGDLVKNRAKREVVTDFFTLRDICTPPGGQCPKSGPNWEKAKAIALLFSKLGEDSVAQRVQLEFFKEELDREKDLKRPKLHGGTIADYLYAKPVNPDNHLVIHAARALFWGMWQNAPREAEADKPIPGVRSKAKSSGTKKLLTPAPETGDHEDALAEIFGMVAPKNPRSKVLGATKGYDLSTPEGLEVLAKGFARSTFGNWGVAKAKANGRMSRYQKVAMAINEAMGQKIIPEYWR